MTDDEWPTYLFEYPYQGARWRFEFPAQDEADARARLKALAWAEYKGRLVSTIAVPRPARPFVRGLLALRSWLVPRS